MIGCDPSEFPMNLVSSNSRNLVWTAPQMGLARRRGNKTSCSKFATNALLTWNWMFWKEPAISSQHWKLATKRVHNNSVFEIWKYFLLSQLGWLLYGPGSYKTEIWHFLNLTNCQGWTRLLTEGKAIRHNSVWSILTFLSGANLLFPENIDRCGTMWTVHYWTGPV